MAAAITLCTTRNAANNGKYGIWIRGSNGNRVQAASANSNGNTGIYVGCADTAGPGGSCSTPGTGSENVIEHGRADTNGVNGIGVDSGDLQNKSATVQPAGTAPRTLSTKTALAERIYGS
jgi:hypothetical protein